MRTSYCLLEAPSILGLRPTGVETLPEALIEAGLVQGLQAEHAGRVEPPPYNPQRDPVTLLLNGPEIRDYALRLAGAVEGVRQRHRFPVVLGGDCSILLGCMFALRRAGRYGLCHIDGHADFYQPEAEPQGEVASMDLAIVTGRGPEVITDIAGLRPLVRDEDVVQFGARDAEEAEENHSQDIRDTGIHVFDLAQIRASGVEVAAAQAVEVLRRDELAGFWIHLDADVMDDALVPTVDYRLPGGLGWEELTALLKTLLASGRAVGLDITIFNPRLDVDGAIARRFVGSIVAGLHQAT
jgi:arginase